MKKRLLSVVLSATLATTLMAGCGSASTSSKSTSGAKEIYFLNFKPEIASVYKDIAAEYEKETGVKVKVVTAAAGTYEATLKSEIAKSDAPTIFQINGPVGYQNWKDYCADLKDTKFYSYLTDKSLAVTDNGGVYGIPYVVEGYGIIYNDAIMKKYFALSDKAVSVSSTADIKNFDTLKKVVEDMTKHKAQLGIKGVFGSTSLKAGEQRRWQTHLANLPFYYEFKDNTKYTDTIVAGLNTDKVDFKYANNYKNIFDLYINNSITDKKLLGSKSVDDSMSEFALGNVAMVQNGNWAWSQIKGVSGNTVKEDDIKFMPIYTGVQGEENQGLCIGTENYFAINSKVSKEKQDASVKFLEWLYSSDKGKDYVTNKLGFIAPFNTFKDSERPTDPLAKEVARYMTNGTKTVAWTFAAFPSEDFKNQFGDALLQYAQGKMTWDQVVKTVKDAWASEKAK
jgi:raffinose/stachyose/melibiose transport system substrate-binding protein